MGILEGRQSAALHSWDGERTVMPRVLSRRSRSSDGDAIPSTLGFSFDGLLPGCRMAPVATNLLMIRTALFSFPYASRPRGCLIHVGFEPLLLKPSDGHVLGKLTLYSFVLLLFCAFVLSLTDSALSDFDKTTAW